VWHADPETALGRLVSGGEPGDVRADRAFDLGVELLLASLRARLLRPADLATGPTRSGEV
jgi:hypothetical protein